MAAPDIASSWLEENKVEWTKADKARRRDLRAKSQRYKGKPPVFYSKFDRDAYGRWRHNENKAAKAGRFSLLDFVKDHVGFSRGECLLAPFHTIGVPSALTFNGRNMAAARAMCLLAHGTPRAGESVVRHMCGNGHLSCVNPRHLVWGTPEDNSRDRHLHTARPMYMPCIDAETVERMRAENLPVNVLSVMYQIPASVVSHILSA